MHIEQGQQLHDAQRFGVQRAASTDIAVDYLTAERIEAPLILLGRYYIHVVKQDEGFLMSLTLYLSPDRLPARFGFVYPAIYAFAFQYPREKTGAQVLIARRISGIQPDIAA
jgi:hypothetical protein